MVDRILVWIRAGLLVAGLTAGTLTGAGAAVADDGTGDDGNTSSSETSDSSTKQDDSDTADTSDDVDTDASPTEDTDDEETKDSDDVEVDEDVERPATKRDKDSDRKPPEADPVDRASPKDDAPVAAVEEPTTEPVVVDEPEAPVVVGPTTEPTPSAEIEAPQRRQTTTTTPSAPNVIETVSAAITSTLTSLLNPFAGDDDAPIDPAAQTPMWTLAAAARREFENAFQTPTLTAPVDAFTTSDVDVVAAEGTLTYTAPPSFGDAIALVIHRVFRAVKDITGFDVHATLGAIQASQDPPFFLTFGLDARKTTYTLADGTQWQAWEFVPPNETDKVVVAFHGGGWILRPTILHWVDYTNMARETGATVVVPLYPLATTPDGAALKVVPQAADFLSQQIAQHGAENVSVYADSAGVSLAMGGVRELILAGKPLPSSMVLISGVMDNTLSNPAIRDIYDPLFNQNDLSVWDSHWYDGIVDRADPRISPLYFSAEVFAKLPPTTIYVGDQEILYPDSVEMYERGVAEDVPISVVVGRGLIHGWPISGLPLYSATPAVRPDVYRQLGLTGVATTLAVAAAPAQPTLINIVGTLAWSVLDAVTKLIVGAPSVPPGSPVSAGQSTIEIDCGDGYLADADWYYPTTGQPDKFIYFQHGFLARASVYNSTLAELAERNNAIVVAPSITSNYFACDGCSLTADPMHAAVARLFEGDRAALIASARAAGFDGELPTDFVFAGQSAGAMLAAGASGYYYASAPAEQKVDMVGVLLYDGSAANGALARALDKLPSSVPVLHVAGTPTVINNGGDANQVLAAKRPGQFNGVQLVGGSHSDAFQSSAYGGLVQAFVGLTFGPSRLENVEAVHVLSQGWLTDMYAGRVYDPATRTGMYGTPGQPGETVIDIPTDAGPARGYVLPGPPPALSPIEKFIAGLLQSVNSNDFVTCGTGVEAGMRSGCT